VDLLTGVLVKRRDKIARAYLPKINPLIDCQLDASGLLRCQNAAVRAGVAETPSGGYQASWYRFDNATGEARLVGVPSTASEPTFRMPVELSNAPGNFVKVSVAALDAEIASWQQPLDLYFKRTGGAWKLVGLERLP